MAEIFYSGEQAERVTVRQGEAKRPLDPRYDLRKHSQRGLAWGNGDGGQLSLALLADALQNDTRALRLHDRFNRRVVAILPERWTITRSRIVAYVNLMEQEVIPPDAT
jgi:Family of unknown function (DUF6166)